MAQGADGGTDPLPPNVWRVPFNRVRTSAAELQNIIQAIHSGQLAGNGPFGSRCTQWLETHSGAQRAFLTGSCTAALELASLLCDLEPGDEVILPSYCFVTTASSFALRGAVPVFIDIREDTLNLDEHLIEDAITERTKAIVPVHYGGVACEMETIMGIAARHELFVIEDAAQGILASYQGRPLGSIGNVGTLSFHVTKNIVCGEGGALLVNDETLVERTEILQEKGTNRVQFFRGDAERYSWVGLGSSFLLGELDAAFLEGQLHAAVKLRDERLHSWHRYHAATKPLEERGWLRRPMIPPQVEHNAHLYYVLLAPGIRRHAVLDDLHAAGIEAVFHYVPLHSAPAGRRYGRVASSMERTDDLSARLIRLPLWSDMPLETVQEVVTALERAVSRAQ